MIFTLLSPSRKVGRSTQSTPKRDGDITAQPFHAAGPYRKDNKAHGRLHPTRLLIFGPCSRDRALPQKMMAHNVSRTVSVVFFLVHRSAQTLNS